MPFLSHWFHCKLPLVVCLVVCTTRPVLSADDSGAPATGESLTFERDVRPILKEYCLDCHGGGETLEAKLDLRLARFAQRGGESGPAIAPGNPATSLLLERIKSGDMPPTTKKVPAAKVAIIEAWIAAGATTARHEPETLPPGIDITPEERAYWAFLPLVRPDTPLIGNAEFPVRQSDGTVLRTPIDAFLLEKLQVQGLTFSPDADRLTLIRRASFDLLGLPPDQAAIDAFLADQDAGAYERMVDRLLESPHYGERWGRHWLDVAGYAESEGNGPEDSPRPYIYKYRDYVIRAFNADKPWSEFLIEQFAGDELVPKPYKDLTSEQWDKLTATGFLKLGVDTTATGTTGNQLLGANAALTDTLKIVSTAVYGLSLGCAQCHDHRYDPIPQVDYFRLRAVFEPAIDPQHWRRPVQRWVTQFTDADRARCAEIDAAAAELQKSYDSKEAELLAAALEQQLSKFPEDQRGPLREAVKTPEAQRSPEQKQLVDSNPSVVISPGVLYQFDPQGDAQLKSQWQGIAAKQAEKPVEEFISIVDELGLVTTHVHYRGDPKQPRQAVTPGDLTIAAPPGERFEIPEQDPTISHSSGRRLALARHLTSGQHPLVGRALMNRVWLHHFGRGLCDTPGEFGVLGARPTHPELLTWLAVELADQGWSLKQMHRLIMRSTAYRQSSAGGERSLIVDNENRWLSRFPVRRLEAEAVRDRILAVSGRLDRTLFGPSIPVVDDYVGQVLVKDDSPRRSVYLEVKRSRPVSLLAAFDAPVMTVNCDRRVNSTTPSQALMLMNGEWSLKHAGLLAERVRSTAVGGAVVPLPSFVDALPLPTTPQRHQDNWSYGYGGFDESTQAVSFTPLPHWTGNSWEGGATRPDPVTGWAIHFAHGGHASNLQRAPIRRWTAPRAGVVNVTGTLGHGSENGDGVRSRLLHRGAVQGEWIAAHSSTDTNTAALNVAPGDTLDFITDCRANENSDSFTWQLTIEYADSSAIPERWNSTSDFRGPTVALSRLAATAWQLAYSRPITTEEVQLACQFLCDQEAHLRQTAAAGDHELVALTNLCQQLLSSNEFLYVD